MRLRLSDRAIWQIRTLQSYGQENWGESKSDTYLMGLFTTLETIQSYPQIGREFLYEGKKFKGKDIYIYPHESHRIFYVIEGQVINVIAVGGQWQLPDTVLG